MRINHNISAMVTQGSLFQVNQALSKSLQKLSTGLRINTAADDAAGLGVSENLRTQVNGMGQALKNTQDAIAMLNIADGALNEEASILQRMRELVIQGLNDTYSSTERTYMGQEFVALRDELDRIAAVTNYNKMQLFAAPQMTDGVPIYPGSNVNGDPPRETQDAGSLFPTDPLFGTDDWTSGHHFNMMVGANYDAQDAAAYSGMFNYWNSAANMITIQFGQMDANGILSIMPSGAAADQVFDGFEFDLAADPEDQMIAVAAWQSGEIANPMEANSSHKLRLLLNIIDGGENVDVNYQGTVFGAAPGTYRTGLSRISEMRARIGAMTNRLEHSITNTQNSITNTQAAESLVRDADFAQETTKFTKNQILLNSATAMLAQANSVPQNVLSLLK